MIKNFLWHWFPLGVMRNYLWNGFPLGVMRNFSKFQAMSDLFTGFHTINLGSFISRSYKPKNGNIFGTKIDRFAKLGPASRKMPSYIFHCSPFDYDTVKVYPHTKDS